MDLKSLLKTIKLNESLVSTLIGIVVVLVGGTLLINYLRPNKTGTVPEVGETTENQTTESNIVSQDTTIETTTPDSEVAQPVSDSSEEGSYTIQEGDTLWDIAQAKYGSGSEWKRIAQVNNINTPTEIEKGTRLTIPDIEEVGQDAPTTSQDASQQANPISGATYTVVQGDCLWTIAVRAYGDGYKWVDIARENKLANPDIIHAGNVLSIPR